MQTVRNIMTELQNLSVQQLRQALSIKERIESLQAELSTITVNEPGVLAPSAKGGETASARRRKMSAAGKARIAAGQRARWAKVRAEKGKSEKVEHAPKKRRKMSAAAKAKIAAAAKARWAKAKAAGRNVL